MHLSVAVVKMQHNNLPLVAVGYVRPNNLNQVFQPDAEFSVQIESRFVTQNHPFLEAMVIRIGSIADANGTCKMY